MSTNNPYTSNNGEAGSGASADPYAQPASASSPNPYASQPAAGGAQGAAQPGAWSQPGTSQADASSAYGAHPSSGQAQPSGYGQPGYQGAGYASGSYGHGGQPAPGTSLGDDLSGAFSWAVEAFKNNWKALIIPGLVWFVIFCVIFGGTVITYAVQMSNFEQSAGTYSNEFPWGAVMTLLGGLFLMLFPLAAWYSGVAQSAGMIARGEKPSIGQGMFGAKPFMASLLLFLICFFLGWTFIVPILAAIFLSLSPYIAATDNVGAIEAMKRSARTTMKAPALVIVTLLITYFASNLLGGILITLPLIMAFVALVMVAVYKRAHGELPAEPRA